MNAVPFGLRTYTGHRIVLLGQATVAIEIDGEKKTLKLVVVDGKGSWKRLVGENLIELADL